MIQKMPIFVDLGGGRRALTMNLNTEILIKTAGGTNGLVETIGKRHNEETGEDEPILQVSAANLRIYLWAMLQADAKVRRDPLTVEEVGALITRKKDAVEAFAAVSLALNHYMGDEPEGEASAPAGE